MLFQHQIISELPNQDLEKSSEQEIKDVLSKIDVNKASFAASLIMNGSDVSIKDNESKTPLNYAEENKAMLPKVYEVIMAGKTKQDIEATQPKPDENNVYDWQALTAWGERMSTSGQGDAWGNAMKILIEYSEKDIS